MFPQMIYAIGVSTKPLAQLTDRNACSTLTRPRFFHSEKSVWNLQECIAGVSNRNCMNTCMNLTGKKNSHNTWNITAAAFINLNWTITYKLQWDYTFHDTYSTRLRTANLRRRLIIGRWYREVCIISPHAHKSPTEQSQMWRKILTAATLHLL
jgi:hypothetical protein